MRGERTRGEGLGTRGDSLWWWWGGVNRHLRSREFRDLRGSLSVCLSYSMAGTKARSNVLLGLERFWVICREAHHGSRFRVETREHRMME